MALLSPMVLVALASASESAGPWSAALATRAEPAEQPVAARAAAAISAPDASAVAPRRRLAGAKAAGGVCWSANFMLDSSRWVESGKRKRDNHLPELLVPDVSLLMNGPNAPLTSSHLRMM